MAGLAQFTLLPPPVTTQQRVVITDQPEDGTDGYWPVWKLQDLDQSFSAILNVICTKS